MKLLTQRSCRPVPFSLHIRLVPQSSNSCTMLRDLTWSITVLTDHQRVTQARLDALTRDPAGPNPPNPNLSNPTGNAQAWVPLIALPPPMPPASINPPQVPPAQHSVTAVIPRAPIALTGVNTPFCDPHKNPFFENVQAFASSPELTSMIRNVQKTHSCMEEVD